MCVSYDGMIHQPINWLLIQAGLEAVVGSFACQVLVYSDHRWTRMFH